MVAKRPVVWALIELPRSGRCALKCLIKSFDYLFLERIGLGCESFNSLVFGTFNNVPIQRLATDRLVEKWRSDGHMSGTTAGSTDEDRSKVTKRLTQEKSHRLLLGKEDSLANYIRSNERAFDARGL